MHKYTHLILKRICLVCMDSSDYMLKRKKQTLSARTVTEAG